MRAFTIGLVVSLGLAATAAAQALPPAMSPQGVGPVRIGMTTQEALAAVPGAVASGVGDPATCNEYAFAEGARLYFMIENGKVVRVSGSDREAAVKGVRIGDPEATVRAAYTGVVQEPAPYAEAPAHDLYWWQTPESGLRFEINAEGRVAFIHAGGEAIRYMEGCL